MTAGAPPPRSPRLDEHVESFNEPLRFKTFK